MDLTLCIHVSQSQSNFILLKAFLAGCHDSLAAKDYSNTGFVKIKKSTYLIMYLCFHQREGLVHFRIILSKGTDSNWRKVLFFAPEKKKKNQSVYQENVI